MTPSKEIERLIEIMAALRDPDGGCPWDLEQSFETIAPYTVEEAYEVADAIERRDPEDLRDELGDLLLQVVYHARLAEELGLFSFGDVVESITAKMIRRHPHVFGDKTSGSVDAVESQWDRIKAAEREEKAERRRTRVQDGSGDNGWAAGGGPSADTGLLSSVPHNLPALLLALKLQKKAATVGFDWDEPEPILKKIEEELGEFSEALASKDRYHAEEEFGDFLFSAVNLARHYRIDPERALRRTIAKFRTRFSSIETALKKQDRSLAEATLDEMEALWQRAKADPFRP